MNLFEKLLFFQFVGYDGGMKRGHDDDYEDHGQKRRRGGDGPRVELRFLLASKVKIYPHIFKTSW